LTRFIIFADPFATRDLSDLEDSGRSVSPSFFVWGRVLVSGDLDPPRLAAATAPPA